MSSLDSGKSSNRTATPWRRVKRATVVLVIGFLTLAPPGTLIVGGILLLGLIGKVWLIVGSVFGVVAVLIILLVHRKYNKRLN